MVEKDVLYKLVDSLREAIKENKKQQEIYYLREEIYVFENIAQKVEDSFQFLLPNGFDYFVGHVNLYSTDELFFIEEKASKRELDGIVYSSKKGIEIRLSNGEIIKKTNKMLQP